MKVLVIAASLNEKSGWGRYSRAIIDELLRQGHKVKVLSGDTPDEYSFPIIKIDTLKSGFPVTSLIKNMLVARFAARDAEVVHALDGWPYGVYGWAATLGTKKNLIVNGVGTYAVAPLYSVGSSWLLRRAYARASAIPCISNYTRDQIRAAGIGSEKVVTVHMGAPVFPQIESDEAQEICRKARIPERKHPIVLTVGAIKERKGQLDTLKAIKILKAKYPNILYIVAGSGNQKEYVKALEKYATEHDLKAQLSILVDVDDKTLVALYSACTIFALNSNSDPGSHHFEGFGLVVLEAAEYGKPAVGSKDSGIEDTIDEGKTGYRTKQKDPEDIAARIEDILMQYDFFSGNAKIWRDRFTWQETVNTYIRYYTQS